MKHTIKYRLILILSFVTIVVNGLTKDSGRSGDYQKAILFFDRQQYDSAGYYFKSFLQHIDPINTADKFSLKGKLFLHIGNCELMKNDFSSALKWFTSALTEVKGKGPLAVVAYQNIGTVFYLQSDFESAVQSYQKALLDDLSLQEKDPVRLFEVLVNLGSAYIGNHENQKGLTCLLNAESLFQFMKFANSQAVSGVYMNLGKLSFSSGDPRAALNYYCRGRECLDINRSDHKEISIVADKGIAASYLAMGCFDSAGFYLEKALREIRTDMVFLEKELPGVYLLKGDFFLAREDFDSAFSFYDQALQLISKDLYVNDSTGNKIVSPRQDTRMMADILERNGRIRLILGIRSGNEANQLKRALDFYNESIRINNNIQRGFLKDKSRLVFNDEEKKVYTGALETCYRLWRSGHPTYKDQLWTISESMRGRVLESKLRESRIFSTGISTDTLELKRMAVRSKISEFTKKRISGFTFKEEHSLQAFHKELENFTHLLIEDDSLTLKLKIIVPGCFETENKIDRNSHAEVRAQLRDQDCLLEYYFADSVIYVFLLSTDTFHVERVIPCKSFSFQPYDLTRTIQHLDNRDFPEICHRLYKSLVEPVKPLLKGKRHLIIVPDEEISAVPFEALISSTNILMNKNKGPGLNFLIDEFSVSYQFSASSLITAIRKRYEDPIRFLGIAPGFLNPQASGFRYDPLKSSLVEIRSIEAMFTRGNHEACSMVNEASHKKSILLSSGNFSHLHFATHSILDGSHSEFPGLVVETGGSYGQINSGQESVLWTDEIENSRFKADLVVLSACGTGKGKLTRTEGILGLPRSFFIAGSSNVLYTLWNIPDHHTKNFMEIFYRKFLSGKTYPDALRETKQEMLRSEITSHPYLWAGFVLLGN